MLLAGLCTAALALPAPAYAEDGTPAEPADYTAASDAEEIKGTASSSDAPELAEPGFFTDTIGRGETKYYRVDLDAKSTAYVSALAHPKVGNKVGSSDRLEVRMEGTDGTTCSSDSTSFNGADAPYPIGALASRRIGGDTASCQSADQYLVKVSRADRPTADPGDWPIELRYQLEPGLEGSLPAPPAEGSWSTEPPALPAGEAKRIEGGTGMSSATPLSDGVWRDTVLPGETRFYRVPVDFGQQLFARAQLPNAASDGSDGSPRRTVFGGFGLHVFSPGGARVVQGNFKSYDGGQNATSIGLRPVDYGNRFGTEDPAVSTAGFYILALTLAPNLKQYFPDGADLTLRVKLRGEAKEAPEYLDDARAAGFGVNEDDKAAAEEGRSHEEPRGNQAMRMVGVTGVSTGTALLLALAVWTWVARRRGGNTGGDCRRAERVA